MRIWTGLLGALAIVGVLALSGPTASAQDWCGFHQKAGSQVKCGFSSLQQCKQALADKKTGDKSVTCLPDPAFS
jgi:Protein of unknown function (DUF3551)